MDNNEMNRKEEDEEERDDHDDDLPLSLSLSLSSSADANTVLSYLATQRRLLFDGSRVSTSDIIQQMREVVSSVLHTVNDPLLLILQLAAHPAANKVLRGKVDLLAIMCIQASQLLTDMINTRIPSELQQRALQLLDELPLSPRVFSLLVSLYQLPLSHSQLWQYVMREHTQKKYKMAAEMAIRLSLLTHPDTQHTILLDPLISPPSTHIDTLYHYIAALSVAPDLQCMWRDYIIEHLAEDESGGGNVTAAVRMLQHYHLPLSSYPRIRYLKCKHEVWWIVRFNKAREYAELLCANDVKLQYKLLKELSKARYADDLVYMRELIQQWNLHEDDHVKQIIIGSATHVPHTVNTHDLPEFTMDTTMITIVNDETTMAQAESVLLFSDVRCYGFDLEHMNQSFEVLQLTPSLCQIIQIATHSQTFILDLNLLHKNSNSNDGLAERLNALLLQVFVSEVRKLGMGFAADMKKLRKDFGHLACFQVTILEYYDLTALLSYKGDNTEQTHKDKEKRSWMKKKKQKDKKNNTARAMRATNTETDAASDKPDTETDVDGMHDQNTREIEADVVSAISSVSESVSVSLSTPFVPWSPAEGGLSKLTRMFLHRHLNKTCQISNWSRRPLSDAQLMYAACDAYVQILIDEAAQKSNIHIPESDIEG